MALKSKSEYEEETAANRERRMEWWREARFGVFVHYGLYSVLKRHEWAMSIENRKIQEYEKLADSFLPVQGAPREWVRLAKQAGAKYMVLTTRHHEGFSLWNSKVNSYNCVNYGCGRDLVLEYVEACREFNMKIGFYSSLMDWHHPDGWKCAFDREARIRFTDYLMELNRELMSNYGKIDILWYDVPRPMESWEGWNSLEMNQMVRRLQPDIIINNRSRLEEDFGTPEGKITAGDRDWEACMTFNGISWGYVDSEQAASYSYNAHGILNMLHTCTAGGGNLILNIGPAPDGSNPAEAVEPLTRIGRWLEENGEAVYGKKERTDNLWLPSGLCVFSQSGKTVYAWVKITPPDGILVLGGFVSRLQSARLLSTSEEIPFIQEGTRRIVLRLPDQPLDPVMNVPVISLTFDEAPVRQRGMSCYPQFYGGRIWEEQEEKTNEKSI